MEGKTANGVFINGKAQVIELLKHLSHEEKRNILQKIQLKNAPLARELRRESSSFEQQLEDLADQQLVFLTGKIPAQIFGLALKGCSKNFQKKILKIVPRAYAEEAFSWLNSSLTNELRDGQRAQQKILQTWFSLEKLPTSPNQKITN